MEKLEEKYKYMCIKCNYKCKTKGQLDNHYNTTLHQTGIRKKRSDTKGPYICIKCNKETINMNALKQHKLNEHGTLEEREKGFNYYCKVCDFGTFSKNIYVNHGTSEKHKKFEQRHNLKNNLEKKEV